MIVQNMPGAGHKVAANYLYMKTKPDGLSLIGSIVPSLYFDQLIGRKEIQFDWSKYAWIGSPVQGESQMYMRADSPYKSMDDVRNAKEPPKCGSQSTAETAYFLPKLFEEALGTKFNIVSGYPGGPEIDLAVERGEILCRAFTIEAFLSREPYLTWRTTGFVRYIIQTGKKRDAKFPDTPTMWELMDKYKTPEGSRRLAGVVLGAGRIQRHHERQRISRRAGQTQVRPRPGAGRGARKNRQGRHEPAARDYRPVEKIVGCLGGVTTIDTERRCGHDSRRRFFFRSDLLSAIMSLGDRSVKLLVNLS